MVLQCLPPEKRRGLWAPLGTASLGHFQVSQSHAFQWLKGQPLAPLHLGLNSDFHWPEERFPSLNLSLQHLPLKEQEARAQAVCPGG